MERLAGALRKMRIERASPAHYYLRTDQGELFLNDWVGYRLHLNYTGKIFCVVCGRKISKAFGQGFCFPCFRDSPENSPCIIHPEKCRGHLGEGRDPQWELENHVQPHIVYMAWSSGWKVGITRENQIPTRWLDQGATVAISIARTPYRYLAGVMEVTLKAHIPDKTDWRRMIALQEPPQPLELPINPKILLPDDLKPYLLPAPESVKLEYPLKGMFSKIVAIDLIKSPVFEGILAGMKGQYLVFTDGRVLNIRNHSGYDVILKG